MKPLHPRNKHQGLYDFKELVKGNPDLSKFVSVNAYGNESIDFVNPSAVKALNKAILKVYYDLSWDLPEPFLCPPIPGRADYIHYIADFFPKKSKIKALDIGVGANCIYPLIGHRAYGWQFVGTDINPKALAIAGGIIKQNNLSNAIELRLQSNPKHIFKGVLKENESFDISLCNPPFHASKNEAEAGTQRKWKNLGKKTTALNFGGQSTELWCPGGEVAFIKRMIKESVDVNCTWFTTLVSKESSLPPLYIELEKAQIFTYKTIPMGQGQKKSRLLAWTKTA